MGTTVTRYDDALHAPRGAFEEAPVMAFNEAARDLSALNDLVGRALARLSRESGAGAVSEEARHSMRSPVATALAHALCDDTSDLADLMVADLMDAGLSVADVCLDHLAPAARCLGEWWEADRLPFTEVTMATARIQAMLRRMPIGRGALRTGGVRGAVFCAVPGEQHTLGVMMAADLFRRDGWDVSLFVGLGHDDLMDRFARDDREVIGLSCSGRHSAEALDLLMRALRKRRPEARLILSGQVVSDAEALERLPPADAIVTSMQDAEAELARLDALYARAAVA
ncbi:MAG: cobalamin B12-binding domain-containing protein [Roseicyclus sp.]